MRLWSALAGCFAVASSACGAASGFGLDKRPSLTGLTFPSTTPLSSRYELVPAFSNLEFNQATYLTSPPGDATRLFVLEQGGRILTFVNDASASSTQTFLDLSGAISNGAGEEGLLGLAFDPNYASNGFFYVNYTAPRPLRTVIARFRRKTDDSADPASKTVLLEFNQPYTNHNGGMLAFGPDGYLYIGTGDGGSGGDPHGNGQSKRTLLGKILRLDPKGGSPYKIPVDNPFVSESGARGEIFAYGLRNPWRFSFDRSTKELWVGDVGQDRYEEIDLVVKGDNLGWRPCEGRHTYPGNGPCPATYKAPLHEYDHTVGKSVVGGYVYRGRRLPSLQGTYLFGDTLSRTVWGLVKQGNKVASNSEIGTLPVYLSSFGEDADGEVYLVGYGEAAQIYRIEERSGPTAPFPDRLSRTGLFKNTARLEPNPGLIEYDVNQPLWSDGAGKRRWIGVPNHTAIYFDAKKSWTYPLGTVFVKQFDLDLADGTTRRLETRVLLLQKEGWKAFTYVWNDRQDDADLNEAGVQMTVLVPGPAGPRPQTWSVPAKADCLRCHTPGAGFVLGVNTRQLNRDFPFAQQTDNQLRSWNHVGLFAADLSGQAFEAYPKMKDSSSPLEQRARAYLDVNCASCHRPAGGTPNDIDLRYDTPLASTRLVDVPPTSGDLGISGAMRIAPGDPPRSLLHVRMLRKDDKRMPPLGSHELDQPDLDALYDWIKDLPRN